MTKTLTEIDTAIATKSEILDTYEGMASLYDGESEYPAHIFDRIDDLKTEIAVLEASWNRIIIEAEAC